MSDFLSKCISTERSILYVGCVALQTKNKTMGKHCGQKDQCERVSACRSQVMMRRVSISPSLLRYDQLFQIQRATYLSCLSQPCSDDNLQIHFRIIWKYICHSVTALRPIVRNTQRECFIYHMQLHVGYMESQLNTCALTEVSRH